MNAASPVLNLVPAAPAPSDAAPIAPSGERSDAALPGDFAALLGTGESPESLGAVDPALDTEISLLDEQTAAEDREPEREEDPAEPTEALLSAAMATVQWTVGVERALQLALRSSPAAPAVPAAPTAPVGLFNTAPAPVSSMAAAPTLADVAGSDALNPMPAAPGGQSTAAAAPDAGARAPRFELPPVQAGAAASTTPAAAGQAFVLEGDSVRLPPGDPDLWQRPLAQALGDRLQVQASQGIEQARIRLEPPALGRIEIVLRQEGNQLQVQLSASHNDVVRQLQAMGEGLRQELTQKQGAQVTVQVFEDRALADGRSSHRERQQPRHPQEDTPGQGLLSESKADRRAFTLA